jgi:hypothetical protein
MSETHSRPLTGQKAYGVPWREWSQKIARQSDRGSMIKSLGSQT